jgi:hypothetical protein
MKIIVREDRQIKIRAVVPVNIKDIGGELEKVAVRMLRRPNVVVKKEPAKEVESILKAREIVWERVFSRILASTPVAESLPRPEPEEAELLEPPEPTKSSGRPIKTKTIEIKITLPTLPKVHSWADAKQLLVETKNKLVKTSFKVRIIGGVVGVLVVFLCYHLITSHAAPAGVIGYAHAPVLPKGTPNYNTILPAGKNIQQLGGWTRISPLNKNPVYAYVDRIESAQVNVSEQPLPQAFQKDPEKEVAQLAKNFNATEKIPAKATSIYIATFSDDSQSIVLSKDNLLLLIKSNALLPPTKWVAYVNSLQ